MSPTTRAAVRSAVFLLLAPGTVAGLIPWWITRWRLPDWGAAIWVVAPLSALIIGTGIGFLVHAFARFAVQGLGTPSPLEPTERLVVSGVYRWVRNPMYLAIQAIILGQALLFVDIRMVVYSAVTALGMAAFVRWHEEPVLLERFGDEYREYKSRVPRWLPRRPDPDA
jgi:protein-S-isoprenylcysteine O-methyltransferase Ste14